MYLCRFLIETRSYFPFVQNTGILAGRAKVSESLLLLQIIKIPGSRRTRNILGRQQLGRTTRRGTPLEYARESATSSPKCLSSKRRVGRVTGNRLRRSGGLDSESGYLLCTAYNYHRTTEINPSLFFGGK